MSWTLTTSGACIQKAGANASSTITASGAALQKWSDHAESWLSLITRKDWVADYSTITANFKPALSDVVSDMVALRMVAWDMPNYKNRREAETMLDFLTNEVVKKIEILKEDKNKEMMD